MGYRDLFRISDNRDYRDNHDYHSSIIFSDNSDNHIQQEAIIIFREKFKTPFCMNPNLKVHTFSLGVCCPRCVGNFFFSQIYALREFVIFGPILCPGVTVGIDSSEYFSSLVL
jgi:hypothetical protein